jgi:hypothetical protein
VAVPPAAVGVSVRKRDAADGELERRFHRC